jgi:hypothetical protein
MARGPRSRFTAVLTIFALGLMTLVGCSGKDDDKGGGKGNPKVTKENFEKLKFDMTEKEVTDILGEPSEKKEGEGKTKKLTWKNGNNAIYVDFTDGKLSSKQDQFVTVK